MRDPTAKLLPFLAVAGFLPALAGAANAPPGLERCVVAAQVFLEGLVPEQRRRAVAPADGEARRQPVFPPGSAPPKSGLRTGEMTDGQRIRLHDFLSCGLSSQGYQKILAVMRRNEYVRETLSKLPPAERETRVETGSGFYWITVFGEPSTEQPWGWRLEGHHVGVEFSARGGELEVTPLYLGADPAVMTKGSWAGYRVLDTEFARGLELLESLTPVQRKQAVVAPALPAGMLATPDRPQATAAPRGLPSSSLNDGQRRLLMRLIDEYVGNIEPGSAERALARIASDPPESLHFAWMGPTGRSQPVYYRVQSPSLTIEFMHAPNSAVARIEPDINHIHTWWRLAPAKAAK